MIIFSIGYLILTIVFSEFVTDERRILAKIAVVFSIMFAMASSIHYFVQISFVRFAIAENHYSGIEHFLQSNPGSYLSSVNMLGWTLFLGLSSLFMYIGLISKTDRKGIKIGLFINAISCFLGCFGYLFRIDLLIFVFMNLGIGLGFILLTVSSIRFFYSLKREYK